MSIRQDAGELLIFIYKKYIADEEYIVPQEVITTTKWDSGRINRALVYLKDLGAIKINFYLGNTEGVYNFDIIGLTPLGIHMIEDKKEFKRMFGFEVGVPGVFKFHWGAAER